MKRGAAGTTWQVWKILLGIVSVAALTISWPWWYPWLLWRHSTTSWVEGGPGVDPITYAVTNATAAGPERIPRIIHQTWKTEDVPIEWQAAQASCQAMHPDFEYRLWTDAQSRDFIAAKFPELLPTWDAYPFAIQRADVIRYAVLEEFGGYYIDLDIECLRPLHFLGRYPFVMPKTWPVGFSNDFLAAEPKNPFVRSLVASLPRWKMDLWLKYPTVMFSTGPMLVTVKASFFGDRKSLWVLPDDMYSKYAKGDKPLFTHLYGSSWHGDDAKSVLWILHHPIFLAVLTLTAIVGVVAFFWRRLQRRRSGFRKAAGNKAQEGNGGSNGNGGSYASLVEITTVKDS